MRRLLLLALLLAAAPASAGTLRVATYDVGLTRDGPGLLLAELGEPPEDGVAGVLAVIRAVRPDVLLLTGFDHDHRGLALAAFRARLAEGDDGLAYPHAFDGPVNAGEPSGRDLDGDGRTAAPADAFGWGRFPGHGGMALLSRLPLDATAARTFRTLRWADLPDADLPLRPDGSPFPDAAAQAVLRLSSRAHWDVPLVLPDGGRLHLLASNPTPPLFDGAEGFNRRRNADELRFWSLYLDGTAFPADDGTTAALPAGRWSCSATSTSTRPTAPATERRSPRSSPTRASTTRGRRAPAARRRRPRARRRPGARHRRLARGGPRKSPRRLRPSLGRPRGRRTPASSGPRRASRSPRRRAPPPTASSGST